MPLSAAWYDRVRHWDAILWELCYTPLAPLELAVHTTLEQLAPEVAARGQFTPIAVGARWGEAWAYGWFRARAELPPAAEGQAIVARPLTGGEALVWVDGVEAGAIDYEHHQVTLTTAGRSGQTYDLLLEAYAGHGRREIRGGPIRHGELRVPEPPASWGTIRESSFGVWHEERYQLALDFRTLLRLREKLDPRSLRTAEIDQGLMDATLIVDVELPAPELDRAVAAGRERLRPLLACVNGSTAPTMYAIGHAHIDVAWLWPLAETERKIARTVASQLALLDRYPEYRYHQSQPQLIDMLKRRHPALYERFGAAVRAGRIIIDGGMWVEADTNLPSGESLIRQFLHGKRFMAEEFGVESRMLWLPDVFGYSGALPQIMRGCGIDAFVTMKLMWAYHGAEPFPYNEFWWEGIDGSAVMTFTGREYNHMPTPDVLIDQWERRAQAQGPRGQILPVGFGDGGGGATRDHLEYLRRCTDLEGVPRTTLADPRAFFDDLAERGGPGQRYLGELYFPAHRGTYTSQARTKQANRRSEAALRAAEIWGCAARSFAGFAFGPRDLDAAWRLLLLNQFHDIIPGSSIARVYREALADHATIQQQAAELTAAALARLVAPDPEAITLFNPASTARTTLVPLPSGWRAASTPHGPVPHQVIADVPTVLVSLPGLSWLSLRRSDSPPPPSEPTVQVAAQGDTWVLSNSSLRLVIDAGGGLSSLQNRQSGRELLNGKGNQLRMYRDIPSRWDAWDIDSMYEQSPVPLDEPAQIELLEQGPLMAAVRVRRRIHHSTISQEIRLYGHSRRIDFVTTIDWNERHMLLKVDFPTANRGQEALHEIQFGYISRPAHRSRPCDADRFEVCAHRWSALVTPVRGIAVLNDSRYGVSVRDGTLSPTLLKAAQAPDSSADRGEHQFTYALYCWEGGLIASGLLAEAADLNQPLQMTAGTAAARTLLSVDAPNVIIDTLKPAEDGSGDVILRLYEALGHDTECELTFNLPLRGAAHATMLEQAQAPIELRENTIALHLRPFVVATLRLRLHDA